jgi:hypothetical protein
MKSYTVEYADGHKPDRLSQQLDIDGPLSKRSLSVVRQLGPAKCKRIVEAGSGVQFCMLPHDHGEAL